MLSKYKCIKIYLFSYFRSDDHLYKLYFTTKTPEPILFSSIEEILGQSLQKILDHLQAKYTNDKDALIYLTINQNDLVTGIRSSVHVLRENTIHSMVQAVMSTFHRFVNSNQSLKLNHSFEVFFKVLSGIHVQYSKNRRRAIPLRTAVGSRDSSNLATIPKGLLDFPKVEHIVPDLINECLLLCLFYAYFKWTNSLHFKFVKQILYVKTSKKLKGEICYFLKNEIDQFCQSSNLPLLGLREMEPTVKKFQSHFDCQIIVIKSMQGNRPELYMTKMFDLENPRIYLYLQNNHIYFINNLKLFFGHFKKTICFWCKRFFSLNMCRQPHKCNLTPQTCSLCYGILVKPKVQIQPDEILKYCDNVGKAVFITCRKCKHSFKSTNCFQGHLRRCKGFKMPNCCLQCNAYLPQNDQSTHDCNVKKYRCFTCFKFIERSHACEILKVKKTLEWPLIAVLLMQYKTQSNFEKCGDCFQLKLKFAKDNNLDLKELCEHSQYKSIVCPFHLETMGFNIANSIVVWIETARFFFEQFSFLDDSMQPWQNSAQHTLIEYGRPNEAQSFGKSPKNKSFTNLKQMQNMLAEQKFFNFLVSGKIFNVCFLVEDNVVMFKLLDIFLSNNCQPLCIQRGRKIYALELTQFKIKFLNFTNYVPGQFSEWLCQFGLKAVTPFFPQKFNQMCYLQSKAKDVFKFSNFLEFGDTEKQIADKMSYFNSLDLNQTINTLLYNAMHEKSLLFLKIVTQYLRQSINIQKLFETGKSESKEIAVHPFTKKILTCSSFVMQMCQYYFLNQFPICTVPMPYNGNWCKISAGEYEYTSYLAWKTPWRKICNAFSADYSLLCFGKIVVDGYSPVDKTVIMYNGCYTHMHDCPSNKSFNAAKAKIAQKKDADIYNILMTRFSSQIRSIHIMWECEWNQFKKDNPSLMEQFWNETGLTPKRPLFRLNSRSAVRGGFLETYQLKFESSQERVISFVDANSLYSKIALTCNLPVGGFETLTFSDLKDKCILNTEDLQFYYNGESMECDVALVEILVPSDLEKPFLPFRIKDEFVFYANCRKCAENKLTKPCKHQINQRTFTSSWCCTELAYSVAKLGYKILAWYEVHHYKNIKPVLSDFVKIVASEKLKNSNILKNKKTFEDKLNYCNFLNLAMQFETDKLKLTPNNCQDNVEQKNYFKNCLNSLYGRFALHSEKIHHIFCKTIHDIELITSNPNFEILDFISINDSLLELVYIHKQTISANRNSNMYFTALINAQARIFIYDLMSRLSQENCTILSVDTDAICFAHPPNYQFPFEMSDAFGHFKHVLGANSKITGFYSMGVRSYIITYTDENGTEKFITKVKGMSLDNADTGHSVTPSTFKTFLDKKFHNEVMKIYIPQSRQKFDKQTKLFYHMITAHQFSNELHVKRFVIQKDLSYKTYSYGYNFLNVT